MSPIKGNTPIRHDPSNSPEPIFSLTGKLVNVIPICDPSASYKTHKFEIDLAIQRVLDSGYFVIDQEIESFEKEFAAFHGENFYATGVANGTDAIALCLRSLDLESESEIITSSHTAVATVAAAPAAASVFEEQNSWTVNIMHSRAKK